MRKLFFSVLILFILRTSAGEIKFLGKNLVRYGDFEKIKGNIENLKGWRASFRGEVEIKTDDEVKLKGKRSLKIFTKTSNSYVNLYSNFISVNGNKIYLFSIGFKQKGFSSGKDKYEGVSSSSRVDWFDKNKKFISSSYISRFPYGATNWDLRDGFVKSPENSVYARVCISVSNNSKKIIGKDIPSTLWVDCIQLREYFPPETPEWIKIEAPAEIEGFPYQKPLKKFVLGIETDFRGKGSKWCKVVYDRDTESKTSIYAIPDSGKGIVLHSPYFSALPSGLYRVQIRVKAEDISGKEPFGFVNISSQFSKERLKIEFVSSVFPEKNKYFWFEKDFILRDTGWWAIVIRTYGKKGWFIDTIKIFPLIEFDDNTLIEIYPGIEGEVPERIKPRKEKPYRFMIFAGLFYDRIFPDEFLKSLGENVKIKKIQVFRGRSMSFSGLPETPEEFFNYNVIFLANINVRSLPLLYKNYLKEYVKRGGKLIISGGQQGYERGGWKRSFIEDILPVNIEDSFGKGIVKFEKGENISPERFPMSLSQNMVVCYLHKVKEKKKSEIIFKCGKYPFIVSGNYGKGSVICILGMPFGISEKGKLLFFESKDWRKILKILITGG